MITPLIVADDRRTAFHAGIRDGRSYRGRRTPPPSALLHGNSDYAAGFQAGYYEAIGAERDAVALPDGH